MRGIILSIAFAGLLFLTLQQSRPSCEVIRCMSGYRCENGQCIKQQKQAKKNRCYNHKTSHFIKPFKCKKGNKQEPCIGNIAMLTCGFTADGLRKDFTDDCSPCLDPTIVDYYRVPCADAPKICLENQECINGRCFPLFDGDEDRDRKTCNGSEDCKIVQMCVANKCVEKKQLFAALGKNKEAYKDK